MLLTTIQFVIKSINICGETLYAFITRIPSIWTENLFILLYHGGLHYIHSHIIYTLDFIIYTVEMWIFRIFYTLKWLYALFEQDILTCHISYLHDVTTAAQTI